MRSLLLALALLCAAAGLAAAGEGRRAHLAFPLKRRAHPPLLRGRSLLRNSSFPLHGTVKDLGYFYATVFLGTPARQFAVIIDTGSTITYVPCSSCGSKCGKHKDEAFDPQQSQTYRALGCGDAKCVCGNPQCGCQNQQCFYSRHYAEQSSSQGLFIEDVVHFHDGGAPVPLAFGCETAETGEIFKQEADGIMGLGNSDASIVNQLVRAGVIDDAFSLCFGSVEGDGVLLLGSGAFPPGLDVRYTDLLPTSAHYYLVRLEAIRLAGEALDVRQGLYDIGYGVVLDSGTTFTYLPSDAYKAFEAGVERFAAAHGLKRTPGPDPRYANSDVCWGGAPGIEAADKLGDVFPTLQLQLGGGVSLTLHPLNYLFMHTHEAGAYCLGVFDNGSQGTLLGGITFRNVLIHYDRAQRRVGFAYAHCQRLGQEMAPPCDAMAQLVGDKIVGRPRCQRRAHTQALEMPPKHHHLAHGHPAAAAPGTRMR